jgi:hypothetical protein
VSSSQERIERLDTSLFHGIPTISSEGDRLSWLSIQRAVRREKAEYAYLEIGSYIGGSLQQYYLDPKCRVVYSIDKRPERLPDERGEGIVYPNNTREAMMANLARLDPDRLNKVRYFERDSSEIPKDQITPRPDVCFIDGEHTNEAVVRDFEFCFAVSAPDAVVYFHDAPIVYAGISRILRSLSARGRAFHAIKLKGSTFAILLDRSPAQTDPGVHGIAHGGEMFLTAMRAYQTASRVMPSCVARRIKGWGKELFG